MIIVICKINEKGFTLIELLVVISIISMFSSIVLSSLQDARNRAKVSRAKTELNQLVKAIVIAREEQNKVLAKITNPTPYICSEFYCRNINNLKNIAEASQCVKDWKQALDRIQKATNGIVTGLENFVRDPWGSPYGLDENECEWQSVDTIRSAGSDGRLWTSDDIIFNIPKFSSSADYCN